MANAEAWSPNISTDLNIYIATKHNFFDETAFAVLTKVFKLEQVIENVNFYLDEWYKAEPKFLQFVEARHKNNVKFIDNYRHCKLDFGFIFGGDGSILWTNKFLKDYPYSLPVFTFNLGSVGFLSKFTFEEIDEVLDSIISVLKSEIPKIQFYCEYYSKLKSVIKNKEGKELKVFSSINEIVLERIGAYSNWVDIDIDDMHVVSFNADGLLLSTHLGSTAYNASVNGPFLFPGNEGFVLSAISPFAINFKSIVLTKDSKVSIKISPNNYSNEAKVSADSNDFGTITKDQELHVTVGEEKLCLVHRESNLKKHWISKISKLYKWN